VNSKPIEGFGGADENVLRTLAKGVDDAAGFSTVVVNLYRPATDDYVAVVLRGSDDVRDMLEGTTIKRSVWMDLLKPEFERYGTYLIPEGKGAWPDDLPVYEPDSDSSDGEDRWRRGDALFVPIRCSHGSILGILSVDLPHSGKRPTGWQLFKLAALSAQTGLALSDG
jgi:hypothetical protein